MALERDRNLEIARLSEALAYEAAVWKPFKMAAPEEKHKKIRRLILNVLFDFMTWTLIKDPKHPVSLVLMTATDLLDRYIDSEEKGWGMVQWDKKNLVLHGCASLFLAHKALNQYHYDESLANVFFQLDISVHDLIEMEKQMATSLQFDLIRDNALDFAFICLKNLNKGSCKETQHRIAFLAVKASRNFDFSAIKPSIGGASLACLSLCNSSEEMKSTAQEISKMVQCELKQVLETAKMVMDVLASSDAVSFPKKNPSSSAKQDCSLDELLCCRRFICDCQCIIAFEEANIDDLSISFIHWEKIV